MIHRGKVWDYQEGRIGWKDKKVRTSCRDNEICLQGIAGRQDSEKQELRKIRHDKQKGESKDKRRQQELRQGWN